MKALVYKGPRQVEVEDVAIPELQKDYALIKVKACGICGSDVHGYLGTTGRRDIGVIMGHELSGVVEAIDGESEFKPGDRVVVEPTINCQVCPFCEAGRTQYCVNKGFLGVFSVHGGFAEYLAVPSRLLFRLPDDLSFEEGALIEPLAVSKCGVDQVKSYEGKTAVIVGAGTIGLLALAVVKARKAARIIVVDLSDNRLAKAKEMGADYIFNSGKVDAVEEIKKLTDGLGADVSIEAVGSTAPVKTAIDCLRPESDCVWIGNSAKNITLDMQSVVTRGIKIHGTYTYSHDDFGATLYEYREMGIPTDDILSRTLPLEEAAEVIELLANGDDKYVKTMITF